MNKDSIDKSLYTGFLLMLFSIGFIWLRSAYGKIVGGTFVSALEPTLKKFAEHNPHVWYKTYLESVVLPHATIFGTLIMWGELFVALSIICASVYLLMKPEGNRIVEIILLLGLVGGTLLNINFWLAAGWMNPSTESLNLLMFFIQLIGVGYILQLMSVSK